jgi:hypothetical protein
MRKAAVVRFALTAVIVLLPTLARAQGATTSGSIAGIVRDATGGVLPGVTVEAASPALIEKVRSVQSDGQGNYKILDLRPGTYSVTFSLTGFSTVKREGIELTTGFTANINGEMKVGSVEETVTVSGASPVVDVQNVRQQLVLTREVWDALPTGKSLESYVSLTLGASFGGVTGAASQDVGGTRGDAGGIGAFTIHGAKTSDSQAFIDGMNIQHSTDASNRLQHPNQLAFQETTVGGGIQAEVEQGGVVINLVPKEGSNRFTGTFAANGSSSGLQSNNLTPELIASGVKTSPGLVKLYDTAFAVGGPIKKDKLWFFESSRWWNAENTIPGSYHNATPNPAYGPIVIFTPDLNRPGISSTPNHADDIRLTWQAASKHKISAFAELYSACTCGQNNIPGASASPEATIDLQTAYGTKNVTQVTWNYAASNRLLFEARNGLTAYVGSGSSGLVRAPGVSMTAIPMRDITTGFQWNALGDDPYPNGTCCPYTSPALGSLSLYNDLQGSMTFVTGSHAFKAGVRMFTTYTRPGQNLDNITPYGSVRFDVRGGTNGIAPVPAAIYELLNPYGPVDASPENNGATKVMTSALYAQDQWSLRRLTLNLGLRFDGSNGHINREVTVPNDFVASQTFAEVSDSPSWKDLSPRFGGAFDLFGTGKTAIKASIGRYVTGGGRSAFNSPANLLGLSGGSRSWNDLNGNYAPDCDLKNPFANGECGTLANVNRGLAASPSTFYDPNYLVGFDVRQYMWQATAGIQHELHSGVGLNVTYFRTSYLNFTATDNRAVAPTDYSPFCVAAPTNAALGSYSGQLLCGLYDLNPSKLGQVNNYVTALGPYGTMSDVFNGVDVSVSARFGKGGVVQGGVSTGQEVMDNCVVIDSPQAARPGFCKTTNPWSAQTQLKVFGSYPLPWWGLQVSGTFQNLPGVTYNANLVYTSAQVASSLGRNLSAGTVSVPLVPNFVLFQPRFSQTDLRLTKMITVAKLRMQLQADGYNLFNSSAVLALNSSYGALWQQPTAVLGPRLVKFGVQVDWR